MENRKNQLQRARRGGEKGFTLIELLVVIAVLAVLAAVVVFNVTGVKDKGSSAACGTDIKSEQSAVDAWVNDNPTGTLVAADLIANPGKIVPAYLHTAPTSCAAGFTLSGTAATGYTVSSTSPHSG